MEKDRDEMEMEMMEMEMEMEIQMGMEVEVEMEMETPVLGKPNYSGHSGKLPLPIFPPALLSCRGFSTVWLIP